VRPLVLPPDRKIAVTETCTMDVASNVGEPPLFAWEYHGTGIPHGDRSCRSCGAGFDDRSASLRIGP
jgi:hypothetical protein